MGEEIKEKILNFLMEHKGIKYTARDLRKALSKSEGITYKMEYKTANIFSYPTILKWCDILVAEGKIKCNNYGCKKEIWYEEDAKVEVVN